MTISTSYFSTIRREPNIVSYYRLNETSGTKAFDYANRYNLNGIYDGKLSNRTALIENDQTAASKLFGASEANIEIPDATPLHIVGDITIEAWVVSFEEKQTSMILGKMNPTGIPTFTFADPYFLEVFEGKPIFSLGNGTNQTFITSPNKLPVGTPVHIVATCFRKTMSIIVNGVETISGSLGSQEVKASTSNTIYIGAVGNNTKRFQGLISEVALYNGSIGLSRAARHFNIGRQILSESSFIKTFDPPSYS